MWDPGTARRQHLWDQAVDLSYGGILAHRNPKESEDGPEILRPTRPCASRKLSRDNCRATCKQHAAEDKNRILLEGLGSKESVENIGK
jgi:hypothetical protein